MAIWGLSLLHRYDRKGERILRNPRSSDYSKVCAVPGTGQYIIRRDDQRSRYLGIGLHWHPNNDTSRLVIPSHDVLRASYTPFCTLKYVGSFAGDSRAAGPPGSQKAEAEAESQIVSPVTLSFSYVCVLS